MAQPVSAAPAVSPAVSAAGAISQSLISKYRGAFDASDRSSLMQNAVTKVTVDDVALNRRVVNATQNTFSHRLDDWAVTNQKKTGRCWMFAGLNLFRVGAMRQMALKEFEFSQNYTFFWDKFERSNYFLEAMIELADRDIDDRTVAFLLDRPLDDGGQWNMFVNIIRRHGLVPQSVMPETESSSNSQRMNSILLAKLREFAASLRRIVAEGASPEKARQAKEEMLGTIFRILCIHLGTPPETFDWQWQDKDRKFHREGEMTPQEFAKRFITLPLDEYVCLVNDPRESSPMGKTFTVQYLGNVVGGAIVKYLNIEIDLMKEITMKVICDGEPVWFGCDVGKMMQREQGLWDARLFEYDKVYETEFALSKADRLLHHQTLMTHAMLFTGVDVDDSGNPRRWRVENSWGKENGQEGFYTMNDNWFDEHMFEIAARKKWLPATLQAALDEEPIVLPPWDPMGSLAR